VLNLRIPALRERRQDIPVLAGFFLERMSHDLGQERTLSDDAMKALLAYDWPGNVRELENCLEQACAMNTGPVIHITDLPGAIRGENGHITIQASGSARIVPMSELERSTILTTITQLNGDKLMAARLLGIGKTTLYRKLKEYGSPA
jgi:two-component system response regulator HydG